MRSLTVSFACFAIVGCISPDNYESSEQSIILTCPRDDDDNLCCENTEDACGRKYRVKALGRYLDYPALSNGECTSGGSGAYQCAIFAQGLWTKFNPLDGNGRPIPVFTKRWLVAARALQCASTEEGLFVFRNGSSEPPRETDILVYAHNDLADPASCDPDVSEQTLNLLYRYPGHSNIISQVNKENGGVVSLGVIEQNVVVSGANGELCDQNLSDAVMRTVDVVIINNRYFVEDRNLNRYHIIGWIRHPLAGIYGDTGWHEDGDDGIVDGHNISQSFRDSYVFQRNINGQLIKGRELIGWAENHNNGTPFVHYWYNNLLIQDFINAQGHRRVLVYNPANTTTYLIRDGFRQEFFNQRGATSLPLDEEHVGACLSVQNFENGYMCWSGLAVYWFRTGVLPPPRVEAEPPLDNSDSNRESDPESPPPEESEPEEANSSPECYANDWLPCYTGSISTQNLGLCQGGRVLCVSGHWQWNECVGEVIPSSENCFDGLDNDCDSLSDCLDAHCAGVAGCPADLGGSEEFQAAGAEGEEESNQVNCDADGDGYLALSCGGNDCDDTNASIHPGAREVCNYLDDDCDNWLDEWVSNSCFTCGPTPIEVCGDAFDNDCDQRVDEGCPRDSDGDGYISPEDCDAFDALQHPGAEEVCNGEDDDCDQLIDEEVCPSDADDDGFLDSDDCAPEDPTIFPGAPESCNGRDDDCDGAIDNGVLNLCGSCGPEPDERCGDLMDNDCDGIIDELNVCPPDPDFDGDGTLDVSDNCPDTYNQGQADIDGDEIGDACDSHDDRVFPPEVCDGVDNDHDGTADNGYECVYDSWADCSTECGSEGRQHCAGNCVWSLCFPPTEICWNGIDDDCDSYESEDCGTIAGAWCSGANLISNSSFESSLNGWTLEVQGQAQAEMLQDCSTAQDGECALRVVVGRQGRWEDIVLGTNLNLVSGNEYQIRLYTRKRDENIGDAPQVLISSGDGVNNVGVWSQCALFDGWNQCAIRFRARDSAAGYRLLILLGHISGEVLLDDVRVLSCT